MAQGGGSESAKVLWLGEETGRPAPAILGEAGRRDGEHEAFGDGRLWIGQHSGDRDILVFDPTESDPCATVLCFYSLLEHRVRHFPRATALTRIEGLPYGAARDGAAEAYAQRSMLREARAQAQRAAGPGA